MRQSYIERNTSETKIKLSLSIDECENINIDSGCGFLDHMLTLFARHGGFGLEVKCDGDTKVDYHHTVEDIAICLGDAFSKALGDKKGGVSRCPSCPSCPCWTLPWRPWCPRG